MLSGSLPSLSLHLSALYEYLFSPASTPRVYALIFSSPYASSAVAIIEGGLGTFLNKMYRLNTYGSQTRDSWLTNSAVGTENTSVHVSYDPAEGQGRHRRSRVVGGRGEYKKRTVNLLQRQLLGLEHKEEDHCPGNQVEAGIEAECARGRHDGSHTREGETEDTGCIVSTVIESESRVRL